MGDKQETMTFTATVTVTYVLTIEATDEDQATDIAYDDWQNGSVDDVTVDHVEEV